MVFSKTTFVCFGIALWLVLPVLGVNPERNLALHRPYTFSVPPNYDLCTDPKDSLQLTDGKYSNILGQSPWAQKSTVGWTNIGKAVSITIDLGKVQPISGVSWHTFGGSSNVGFPAFIYIWVSEDGKKYNYGGELIAASWRHGLPDNNGKAEFLRGYAYGVHRYLAAGLKLQGRFVKFTAWPGSGYLFSDEIEVLAGDFDARSVPQSNVQFSGDFEEWARDHKYFAIAQVRMMYDLQELAKAPKAGEFKSEIDKLRQEVLAMPMPMLDKLDMAKGLPYTPLHARIWALNGKIQQSAGRKAFFVWPDQPYRAIHPFDLPAGGDEIINVDMIGNEYRPAAVNVSNFTDQPQKAMVKFKWQRQSWPDDTVTLRTARFTETQERVIVATALPEVQKVGATEWQVELPAGVTTQLWMTFHSNKVDRGIYPALLTVETRDGKHRIECPVSARVHAGQMPNIPTLETWGWDYLHLPARPLITSTNIPLLVRLLREYLCTSFWADTSQMPYGGPRDPDGRIKALSNLERFDKWLDTVGAARRYMLYLAVPGNRKMYFGDHQPGTGTFANAVRSYFVLFAEHIRSRGLKTSQFIFLVSDEPGGGKRDVESADLIRLAKTAESGFVFFENPCYLTLSQACKPLMEVSDIICPNLAADPNEKLMEYYRSLTGKEGKMLALYECTDGGWLRSPAGYFRKMAWKAWKYGMKGIGVWSYTAAMIPNTWDDFRGDGAWEMIFATPDRVTPSKDMEGWRAGIEDYEYFCILTSLLERGTKAKCSPEPLKQAKTMLAELPLTTMAELPGSNWVRGAGSKDPNDTFDRARIKLLSLIDRLTDQLGNP